MSSASKYLHESGDDGVPPVPQRRTGKWAIRHEDVACRYGGEEFIILVSGGIQAGRKMAKRLVRVVGGAPFRCAGGLELQITISIGVAAFPDHGSTAAEVVGAADQALYRAKDAGRNRYETAGDAKRGGADQLAG